MKQNETAEEKKTLTVRKNIGKNEDERIKRVAELRKMVVERSGFTLKCKENAS